MTMKITEVAKTVSVKNPHNVDVRKVFKSAQYLCRDYYP
jgi:hypothetical protein